MSETFIVFQQYQSLLRHPPEDDQSILIETSSCNLQFFSELTTTQLRDFHMVSPQVVFTLLIFLTMQSYKFYLCVTLPNYSPCLVLYTHSVSSMTVLEPKNGFIFNYSLLADTNINHGVPVQKTSVLIPWISSH